MNFKKKSGFAMLLLVFLYWIAFPIVPFLDIPNKIAVLAAMVVVGEMLFVIAIALLGKEYWGQIKRWVRVKIRARRRKHGCH